MAETEHIDYPHHPGTLYDCPACERECYCAPGLDCVHCALESEALRMDTKTEQYVSRFNR